MRILSPASEPASRADLHCHSSASELSRLGVQRALGLPECATPPAEVYELAKRRGMDFVTITDHDTIAGVMEIADRPDVFISVELTAGFRGEPQAVHVLCLGIQPEDHEWLQDHRDDVELCAAYMYERDIVCALAHPYYTVAAPLRARHRRRLAELFGIWEVRNGARAPELNRPAATYVATRDGIGVAGSDDHAGIDIGRTWTTTPAARTPAEYLAHIAAGRAQAEGAQGSAAKWAHAAIAIAIRALRLEGRGGAVDPRRVLAMAERVLREGEARQGSGGSELSPRDARALLDAWLSTLGLDELGGEQLIALMQSDDFSHSDLYRRARAVHERGLREASAAAVRAIEDGEHPAGALGALFSACVAVVPYAPASAFLAGERAKLAALPSAHAGARRHVEGERPRVAILADGIGATHGVSRTLEEIRARGVRGFEIEVVGTDPQVDRRLAAVSELDVPFYPGLRIGVPSLPAVTQALTEGGYDAIHVCAPGPAGVAGALLARALGLPLLGSYHTELASYAGLRSGQQQLGELMGAAVEGFYGACDLVLSPSPAADEALGGAGVPAERVLRWDRGVDTERFNPSRRRPGRFGEGLNVLYAGRISREKGVEVMVEAFLAAQAREPRLHLLLAGGGPEQDSLRARLGERASFLGWLHDDELAEAYASSDVFLFPSATDTFGQVVLEAQASGLPVVAVDQGGPRALIEDGVSGLLRAAERDALAEALLTLSSSPLLRERLGQGALRSARARTWEATLDRLGQAYGLAIGSAECSAQEAGRAA